MPAGSKDFIEWDVRNWSVALDFWTATSAQTISTCSALEIGSKNGGLSLWMASQGARVCCSDLRLPGPTAIELHESFGVSHLIDYHSVDVNHIPYTEKFDIVLFKSVLGHVGRRGGRESQAHAVSEMHRALKKGGELFFAENLVSSPVHRFLRRRFVKWGGTWEYVSVSDMLTFLSPFAQVQYRTIGFLGALGRTEFFRSLFGILDARLLNHLVPEGWRYIIVGVARK